MEQLLNTLFLMTEGAYLHVEGDGFRIEMPDKTFHRLPQVAIGGVAIVGNIMVSPQALGRCAQEGRTITFFDRNGRFLARVEGAVSGNILLRRAQHQAFEDLRVRSDLARSFIAGKLQNARTLLLRSARDAKENKDATRLRDAADEHAFGLKRCEQASDLETLMGVEGTAAAAYFSALPAMLRSDRDQWGFQGRNRRPPRDPVNALLSYLYSILTHDVRSALEGVGLDPQLGFLHSLRPGRPALALDMMEELRPVFADRLVMRLINLKQIQPKHFTTRSGGAVVLSDDARKATIVAYQDYKKETKVKHPATQRNVSLGLIPHLQARLLARVLRGEGEGYMPFLMRG